MAMTQRKIVGLVKPGFSGIGDLNCPGDPGCPGYVDPSVNAAIQQSIADALALQNAPGQQFPTTQTAFNLSNFVQQYQTPLVIGGIGLFALALFRRGR